MMKPALAAAIAVFTELGWAGASIADAPTLPLGTPDQQRIAVTGLRTGEWGEFGELRPHTYGWISHVGVPEDLLAVFAVRVGVDARRAAQVTAFRWSLPEAVLAEVVTQRGAEFAARFAAQPRVRTGVAVRLVVGMRLDVPTVLEYVRGWAEWAHTELGLAHSRRAPDPESVGLIAARFTEHVVEAIALGVPAKGCLAPVMGQGVEQGWLDPDLAVDLAFAGLDSAQRPGDRKAWAEILLDDLMVSESELLARTDALVPLLATGEAVLIERIGTVLLAGVGDDALPDVAISCLAAPTKKAARAVLLALASRSVPSGPTLEAIGPQLVALGADRDSAVARAAGALVDRWGMSTTATVSRPTATASSWRPTPVVWTVPRFARGPETAEALTQLAAELTSRPGSVIDVVTERFLAVATSVARADRGAARAALQGVGETSTAGLAWVADWRQGRADKVARGRPGAAVADRERAVVLRLGELPCLLSEPSFDDLSIDARDLVDRLRTYERVRVAVAEADLFLALTRVDAESVTPDLLKDLRRLAVPVSLDDGGSMSTAAGAAAAMYLSDPMDEPVPTVEPPYGWFRLPHGHQPASLKAFPQRITATLAWDGAYSFAAFPGWGDAGLLGASWGADVPSELGLVHRQLARRRRPLTGGMAINLLGAPRSCHPLAQGDAITAVIEAWDRGLLRPGAADVRRLDWRQPPAALASFATLLVDSAEAGLLSVVWPVLDDLLTAAVSAPRLLAGAAEVAEAMLAVVPEVLAAMADGRADPAAGLVPGVRVLAARPGSSRAVVAARKVVAVLPAAAPPEDVAPPERIDAPFATLWSAGAKVPVIDDGVRVSAEWVDAAAPTRILRFSLELPGRPEASYRVTKGWTYDLEYEGQCRAELYTVGDDSTQEAWLRWDQVSKAMTVSPARNWRERTDGPLSASVQVPPLTSSLLTVVLGLAAQDGDNTLVGRRLVADLVDQRRLGADGVRLAMRSLLASPAVSPAKLAGLVVRAPRLIAAVWPVLTEGVRAAGAVDGPLPTWTNAVLEAALGLAPHLREAARRGLLGDSALWDGLSSIAGRSGSSAAVVKARTLMAALGL